MTDEQIIDGLKGQQDEALLCLKERYSAYCGSIALSLLRSEEEAEQCLNDLWLALWNCKEPISNLKAYLAKATRNLALHSLQKNSAGKRNAHLLLLDELSQCIPDPLREIDLESWVLRELLQGFVQNLSQEERFVFLGRYWYGYTIGELGQKLRWRENKVSTLLFRLRKRLKKSLEKEGIHL